MWFILLIVKQANTKQDTENACYANSCERNEEIYGFVCCIFLETETLIKLVTYR